MLEQVGQHAVVVVLVFYDPLTANDSAVQRYGSSSAFDECWQIRL
jgi:hypothetical protein